MIIRLQDIPITAALFMLGMLIMVCDRGFLHPFAGASIGITGAFYPIVAGFLESLSGRRADFCCRCLLLAPALFACLTIIKPDALLYWIALSLIAIALPFAPYIRRARHNEPSGHDPVREPLPFRPVSSRPSAIAAHPLLDVPAASPRVM